jgi:glycosyltransferase involved in cell wall biosynthesis
VVERDVEMSNAGTTKMSDSYQKIASESMNDHSEIGRSALRCLWLTRMDPTPCDAGDLTYSFHLLSSLHDAGAQVTVLAMRPTGDRAGIANGSGIEWVLAPSTKYGDIGGRLAVRSLFSRLPNVATQYNNASFRRALRVQMAKDWDVIVVDHLGMGWVWSAVEAYRRRRKSDIVLVFIAHQCEGEVRRGMAANFRGNLVRKIGLSIDAMKAVRLEQKLLRQADLVSAITNEDLCRFGALDKTVLLTPGYAGRHVASCEINNTTPRRALILGNAIWLAKQMNLVEFISAADELFHERQIELWVVGKVPNHFEGTNRFRATRFLGYVKDLEPIFRGVRIGIVAERTGGGFKLKTLDYVFNRVPIAAIRGGIAGLPLTPGLHYLSFESMRELAQGVAAMIDDIGRLNSLQQAAYEKCNTAFDWSDRGRTLRNAIQQAVSRQRAAHAGRA